MKEKQQDVAAPYRPSSRGKNLGAMSSFSAKDKSREEEHGSPLLLGTNNEESRTTDQQPLPAPQMRDQTIDDGPMTNSNERPDGIQADVCLPTSRYGSLVLDVTTAKAQGAPNDLGGGTSKRKKLFSDLFIATEPKQRRSKVHTDKRKEVDLVFQDKTNETVKDKSKINRKKDVSQEVCACLCNRLFAPPSLTWKGMLISCSFYIVTGTEIGPSGQN
jgi:hypothetical protein